MTQKRQKDKNMTEIEVEKDFSATETSKKEEKRAKKVSTTAVDGKIEKSTRKQKRLSTRQKRILQEQQYKDSLEHQLFVIAKEQKLYKKWYKMDNSALMYPMISSALGKEVFRVSALLNEEVDAVALQYALNDIYARFPTMTGCIKKGFFWPYLDKPQMPIVVTEQKDLPCRPLPLNGLLSQMRVQYFKNEVICEFFHSATDGAGAMVFLNSLLACYFNKKGIEVNDMTNCLDYRDKPNIEEIKDHIATVAVRKNPPKMPKPVKARHFKGAVFPNGNYVTRRAYCDAKKLHAVAKQHDATITELLGAAQLMALNEHFKYVGNKSKRPIRILVAVNLRKIFKLDTLRNFANYIFYQYNGFENFEQALADVKKQQKEQLNIERFTSMVSYNYNSGNHPLLKIVPFGLKKIVVTLVVKTMGDGVINSSALSNLGVLTAPKEFEGRVLRYDFQLGKGAKNIPTVAVVTYNGICSISMVSSVFETVFERTFLKILTDLGVDFALETEVVEGLE